MILGILSLIMSLLFIREDDYVSRSIIGYLIIGLGTVTNIIALIVIIIGKVRDCIHKKRSIKAKQRKKMLV